VGWGDNSYLQSQAPAALQRRAVSISAGLQYSLAITDDGRVVAWGLNADNRMRIPASMTNVLSITAGYVNSVITLRDGSLHIIGSTNSGANMTRSPTRTSTPTP
jgi:alpha-tubulin suppressor-like RCC1 family protein